MHLSHRILPMGHVTCVQKYSHYFRWKTQSLFISLLLEDIDSNFKIFMHLYSQLFRLVKMQEFGEQSLLPMTEDKVQKFKKFEKIKKIVMLGFLFLILYALWERQHLEENICIIDIFHQFTQSANKRLLQQQDYRLLIIVTAQLLIDIALVGLIVLFLTESRNFYPFVWMLAFYVTRALLLNLIKFPFPHGFYWESQGVPSLGVPYGKYRDFFYSGHTGFMVFSIRIWSGTRHRYLFYLFSVGTLQVIYVLLITRVHYLIDIFAGWIFSEWFSYIILKNMKICDFCISALARSVTWVVKEIEAKIQRNINIFREVEL